MFFMSGREAGLRQQQPKTIQGDHQNQVHFDIMVLVVIRWGKLDCMSNGYKKPRKPRVKNIQGKDDK
jgi:hypothetical protein